MDKIHTSFYWFTRILAAVLMFQSLFFKFSGAEESVFIFETVGMEPWGRIGIGMLELIACVALLVKRIAWVGGILAAGVMAGAILMHLTLLGIAVNDDGGQLFIYAVVVFVCSLYVIAVNKSRLQRLIARFIK